jgi:hypothetical protein
VPWLTLVIPANQETEIRRIDRFKASPRQTVLETLSQKGLAEWLKV